MHKNSSMDISTKVNAEKKTLLRVERRISQLKHGAIKILFEEDLTILIKHTGYLDATS